MAKQDYQKIASAFLDMWQERLTESLNSQDTITQMMQMMQRFQTEANPFNHAQQPADRHTPDASDVYDDELRLLSERLGDCERRIRELESQAKPTKTKKPAQSKKPAAKPKKQSEQRSNPASGARASGKATGARKPAAKRTVKKTVKKAVRRTKS